MELKKLLSQPPFEEAKIIVGHELLERNITSAMVLEAVDIENWGEPNQMILTSYFALKALSNDELDYFFSKMCTIGIGVLVLKLERLLYDVPEILITLSEKYKLPLLTIPKSIRYETILFAVLRPVINHNANLLDTYYQTRQALNKMAQKIPTIEEMLTNFKYLLKLDFQFTMPLKQQTIATNPGLMPYKILHSTPILTENFMTFKYVRYQLSYADENKDTPKTAICVDVPNLENQKYLLVVFEQRGFLGELDYMVLENAVEFLQAELLKNYTIRHSQFLKKNDLMVDLLNNRYYSTIEQDEILSLVGLNMFEYYQGAMFSLYESLAIDDSGFTPLLQSIIETVRETYAPIAYYTKSNRVIFIRNFKDPESGFGKIELQAIVERCLNSYTQALPGRDQMFAHIAISNSHNKHSLKDINKECLDTTKMMHHFYHGTHSMYYDNLGVFKYFLETDSLGQLEKFIPNNLARLKEEAPELFKTLKVFLMENQNYVSTANRLFIHHKTVRYRIDKVKTFLDIDFTDSEQILLYQIAIRLYELM